MTAVHPQEVTINKPKIRTARSRGVKLVKPEQAALAYADAWHRALDGLRAVPSSRTIDLGGFDLGGTASRSEGRHRVVGVGEYTRRGPGRGSASLLRVTGPLILMTPIGPLPLERVRAAMDAISEESGALLARVARGSDEGKCPASLMREAGTWQAPKERMVAYAMAALVLAQQLGDRVAKQHLDALAYLTK